MNKFVYVVSEIAYEYNDEYYKTYGISFNPPVEYFETRAQADKVAVEFMEEFLRENGSDLYMYTREGDLIDAYEKELKDALGSHYQPDWEFEIEEMPKEVVNKMATILASEFFRVHAIKNFEPDERP
jgi:hypothetical protein